MTREEMFQKVWDHFVVNGNPPSYIKQEPNIYRCLYRGPNGAKCPVGLLIPDDKYDIRLEEHDALQVLNYVGAIPDSIDRLTAFLIDALREAHDIHAPIYEPSDKDAFKKAIKQALEGIATKFRINYQTPSSEVDDVSNNNGLFDQT